MARLGRSHPIPVTANHPLRYSLQTITLPAFESVSEWPALPVVTPNAQVYLEAFESVSEWPAITLDRGRSFTLGVFESVSEWPTIVASVPVRPGDSLTGADGEVEWNGTLWGPTTNIKVLIPVDGWLGSPAIDNGNVPRPSRHGAWDARKFAQQRIVSLRLQANSTTDPMSVDDLLEEVLAATGIPDDDTPLPLVIKARGKPRLAMGQVIDRPIVLDGDYNAGIPTIGLIIACGDPRLYGLDSHGAVVAINTPTSLANIGNASTELFIRIKGPVTNPSLFNAALSRTLAFTVTVEEGQALEIDTREGSATIGGDNAMSALGSSSAPVWDFVLPAGSSEITYTATSGGSAGAEFTWSDATL